MDTAAARDYFYKRERQRQARGEAERQRWLQRVRTAILELGPHYADLRRVYLFGSLVQPGRFKPDSDIDIALECDSLETESAFWRALERALGRDVDLRSLTGPIAAVVANSGEQVYERQDPGSDQ